MRISTLPNKDFNGGENSGLTVFTGGLSTILAGVFIVAGIYKWADPIAFQISLLHLDLFPEWMITPLVYAMPVIEILLGLVCLTVRFREAGYCLLFLLTTAYTVLLLVECLRGISPGCGCFGAQSAHWTYWALITRNLGLLLIELLLIRADVIHALGNYLPQNRLRASQ